MSKVICDICDTQFDAQLTHCPLCGAERRTDAVEVPDAPTAPELPKSHGKGGRFSNRSVRLRNQAGAAAAADAFDEILPEEPEVPNLEDTIAQFSAVQPETVAAEPVPEEDPAAPAPMPFPEIEDMEDDE